MLVPIEPLSEVTQLVNVRLLLKFDKAASMLDGKIWICWYGNVTVDLLNMLNNWCI